MESWKTEEIVNLINRGMRICIDRSESLVGTPIILTGYMVNHAGYVIPLFKRMHHHTVGALFINEGLLCMSEYTIPMPHLDWYKTIGEAVANFNDILEKSMNAGYVGYDDLYIIKYKIFDPEDEFLHERKI
jgi:hypothetical protein